ncbi:MULTISPECIES: TIGR03668 family PPOX class F420-dependent oxidoreductase [Prauserella salsuginis group]|uniref:TIGR03668 family PPOX class F420-dependent oxidoreductase n=1 Tax=Prauserella salsuginis TaxID=387889 RepID=A0ABW6G4L4_9PSEU|nr:MULTISPECIES: TIGR03668 family PPOX class F420-dependent oxidoreductase [Prauserella salsuginis group]MCR3718133.1 PPOX class probable F420-dependent enzyme, Rv0121 family [Prauserella flava]MCR3732703.1 PPOX class probable F420-dependent enzyme, Rv0121 family [Prauserella salsuginis]
MKLDPVEARSRFLAARVATLATADADGVPHLVPVTFAVEGDTVVFAIDDKPKSTLNLRRLRNITANPRVSLLVDHYEDDWRRLWWVRADGTATVHDDGTDRMPAIRALTARYPQYEDSPPRGPVVAIAVSAWSGWSAS